MIFDISFSILNFFLLFFNFHFFKRVIFGYFLFLAKNTPKLKELFKKRSKSSICPIIFHISFLKNPLFDVDLFSRTFDMESPYTSKTATVTSNVQVSFSKLRKQGHKKLHLVDISGWPNVKLLRVSFLCTLKRYLKNVLKTLCTFSSSSVQLHVEPKITWKTCRAIQFLYAPFQRKYCSPQTQLFL